MENATYLQNTEEESNMPTFEVDSIELATPELFSDNIEDSSFNQDSDTNELDIFDNTNSQNKKEDETEFDTIAKFDLLEKTKNSDSNVSSFFNYPRRL